MKSIRSLRRELMMIAAFILMCAAPLVAQVGKGLLDINTAPEKELLALPHMSPPIVKGILDHRPFTSITDLHAYLLAQKLTADQTTEIYRKGFIHVNLNTGAREEIILIPGAGTRMAREFA